MKKVLSVLLVLIIVLGGGGYLLATTADAATPTDPLYQVDLFAESVQRVITFDDVAKAELEQEILDERAAEVESLVGENADEAVLSEAVAELDQQRLRTEDRVQILLKADGNYEEADVLRVRTRYEEQLQEQLQNMEQVQEKYQNVGEEEKKNFEDAAREMNSSDNGNTEQNVNDDAGDGVNNNESNGGPTDSAGSDNGNGR